MLTKRKKTTLQIKDFIGMVGISKSQGPENTLQITDFMGMVGINKPRPAGNTLQGPENTCQINEITRNA